MSDEQAPTESNNEQALAEQIAAYALGALDADEKAAVEMELQRNPAARHLLEEMKQSVGLLPFALQPQNPPPDLRERIMKAAAITPQPARGATPVPPANREAEPPRRSFWEQLFSTFTGRLSLAAGVLAVILLLISGILAANVAQQQAQIAALQRDLVEQQQLVRVLSDPNQVQHKLAGSGIPGVGSVYFDPQKNQAVVVVQDMPSLPENEEYQLWLIQGNNAPIPMPTFTVNQDGQAAVILTAPAGIGKYDGIAITREPRRGSTTPTLPIVMSGKLG